MNGRLTLSLAMALVALQATPGLAQDAFLAPRAHDGAFAARYPDAARLLDALDAGRSQLFAQLAESGATPRLESETYPALVASLTAGSRAVVGQPSAGLGGPVGEILARGRALRRQILDIHADDRVTDKEAAVDRVVEAYLGRPEIALPAQPKSVVVMDVLPIERPAGEHGHHNMAMQHGAGHEMPAEGDHAGHHMPGMAAAGADFWEAYPRLGGLLRAQQWLENAIYEPLLAFSTPAEQREGVAEATRRFHAMFADAPASFPYEMPTTAAIAPELSMRHVRASVILNHLHMLEESIVRILAAPTVADRETLIQRTVAAFTDPSHETITDYDWILQSLRPGIYAQGGPVIGKMERSERNEDSRFNQNHEGHEVMPGMPTGGGRM